MMRRRRRKNENAEERTRSVDVETRRRIRKRCTEEGGRECEEQTPANIRPIRVIKRTNRTKTGQKGAHRDVVVLNFNEDGRGGRQTVPFWHGRVRSTEQQRGRRIQLELRGSGMRWRDASARKRTKLFHSQTQPCRLRRTSDTVRRPPSTPLDRCGSVLGEPCRGPIFTVAKDV